MMNFVKNCWILSAMFIILSFTYSSNAVAQEPLAVEIACNPDCPDTPFPPSILWPAEHIITLQPSGCQVSVQWCKRFACGIWYDLYIARITVVTPNDAACAAYFASTSEAQILADVTKQMLIDNPMQFPPDTNSLDTCVTNWRVVKGACWQKIYTNLGTLASPNWYRRLYPCLGDICCLDRYQVCIVNRKRTITQIPGGVQGTCLPTPPIQGGQGCANTCGDPDPGS